MEENVKLRQIIANIDIVCIFQQKENLGEIWHPVAMVMRLLAQRQNPQISQKTALRIDKGSRPVIYILGCIGCIGIFRYLMMLSL